VFVLGKGWLAIKIARWFRDHDQWELKGVVPVVPEPNWTESLSDWAVQANVKCVAGGDYRELGAGYDLVFSAFYDRILTADWLSQHGRCLNLHNAPLPGYRGVNPINWALKNGEKEHGVTIHEITAGIDDGPIVARLRYPIWPEREEVADVYDRALRMGWILFSRTMPYLDRIVPVMQDESKATYYSRADAERLGDRSAWRRTSDGA
jgi:methionyl-tRNA formyltransferase